VRGGVRKVGESISKDSDKVRRNGNENQSFHTVGDECQYFRVRGEGEQGLGFVR
jgi:hypothetical protein